MSWHRGDWLIAFNEINNQYIDKIKKFIIKLFKDIGFNIEIMTNLVEVNVMDITFNLKTKMYGLYKKPNSQLA